MSHIIRCHIKGITMSDVINKFLQQQCTDIPDAVVCVSVLWQWRSSPQLFSNGISSNSHRSHTEQQRIQTMDERIHTTMFISIRLIYISFRLNYYYIIRVRSVLYIRCECVCMCWLLTTSIIFSVYVHKRARSAKRCITMAAEAKSTTIERRTATAIIITIDALCSITHCIVSYMCDMMKTDRDWIQFHPCKTLLPVNRICVLVGNTFKCRL